MGGTYSWGTMANHQSNAGKYDPQMRTLAGTSVPHRWYDPLGSPFRVSGFPWLTRDGVYRRLPLAVDEPLPEAVDVLANCTAGGQIAFRSDSTHVAVKATLDGLADMVHMPATGQCGFDLYMGEPGAMRFCGASKYDHSQSSYELSLLERPDATVRSFVLNFPLYRGVAEVQIGLAPDAQVLPPHAFAAAGPVVIYGTSITQGGCASRPGMAYTNILSRALHVEVVNLGFSGSGCGEAGVVRAVASVPNPQLLVLDYEANGGSYEQYSETIRESVRILRKHHAPVPMLVVSRIAYARDLWDAAGRRQRDRARAVQAELVEARRADGDQCIGFIDGTVLLGDDFDECTVDGVHPNDLGFMRIAAGLEPTIRGMLGL
jgi:lysophospholipase L1-like esterase